MLVTLDTLRADAFEVGGGAAGALPELVRYAERGAVFSRSFASSNVTQPTHASLFTGLAPWQHGVVRNGLVLAERFDTVAERLSAQGFATAAVVASFPLAERFGFAQGFDEYREVFDRQLVPGMRSWQGAEVPADGFYSLAGPVLREASDVLDSLGEEHEFLWIHLFDAHDPYGDAAGRREVGYPELLRARATQQLAPSGLLRRARSLYAADLAVLDAALARFLEELHERSGETHVIVTADHGESFGEAGYIGHGDSLGVQEIRVPLVIVSPRVAPGVRSEPVSSIDLAATLLSLADIEHGFADARDLTGAPAVGEHAAFGMASWGGSAGEAPRARFFAAGVSSLHVGDSEGVKVVESRLSSAGLEAELPARFSGFARDARHNEADALTDEATRAGLRALGYGE